MGLNSAFKGLIFNCSLTLAKIASDFRCMNRIAAHRLNSSKRLRCVQVLIKLKVSDVGRKQTQGSV